MDIRANSKRISQLDGLRIIMCCIIVLSHFEFLSKSKLIGGGYSTYLHNATLAVDYFFMLSGFGIYLSSKRPKNKPIDAVKFALNKMKKIYPAYIVSLFMGCIHYILVNKLTHNSTIKMVMLLGIDMTLFQSAFGIKGLSHSINGVCWFLSTLFICYIVSPFFLRFVDRIKSIKTCKMCIAATFFILMFVSICASYIESLELIGGRINDLWYGNPITRCWYILLGMLYGYLYKSSNKVYGNVAEISIITISILYSLGRNSLLELFDRTLLRIFDVLVCCVVLYVFSKGNGVFSNILGKLGRNSKNTMYIFLFHYPIRMIIDNLFEKACIVNTHGEISYLIEVLLILSLTILFSVFASKLGGQNG